MFVMIWSPSRVSIERIFGRNRGRNPRVWAEPWAAGKRWLTTYICANRSGCSRKTLPIWSPERRTEELRSDWEQRPVSGSRWIGWSAQRASGSTDSSVTQKRSIGWQKAPETGQTQLKVSSVMAQTPGTTKLSVPVVLARSSPAKKKEPPKWSVDRHSCEMSDMRIAVTHRVKMAE